MPRTVTTLLLLISLCSAVVLSATVATAQPVDFDRDIRPILSDRCFPCHGPDQAANKAKLRLDTPAGAFGTLKRSDKHAFVAGDVEDSVAFQRVISDDPEDRMPPPESKLSLSADEISKLKLWIESGADYPTHWSLIALPAGIPTPTVEQESWPRDPLDRFVLAKLEQKGWAPSPETSRELWLRRATLDLTGLPPTLPEIDAFLADKSEQAYETAVDRLLASPAFGERMATPWLDVARYADSYGYQADQLTPAWPYRDWVVRAFNDNLPYDDFLSWQLAGDLLPGATRDQRLATAFNRIHRMTNEGGSVELEFRTEYAADRVHTLGTAVLGLTLECARCHDHKYDPITQAEYYQLMAFFNSIDEWGMYHDSSRVPTPSLLLPNAAQERAMQESDKSLRDIDARIAARLAAAQTEATRWAKENQPVEAPQPAGSYALDALGPKNSVANRVEGGAAGSASAADAFVEARVGKGLQFGGDDAANFPKVAGALRPWEPFTIAFWIRVPKELGDAVIFHRTGGTDVGRFGTELVLRDGRLQLGTIRFWPGNAIAIRATTPLPRDRWVHVAARSTGEGRARGLTLFVDGAAAKSETLHDRLSKSPSAGGSGVAFGARFRDAGLTGAILDELNVFARALSALEVQSLVTPEALTAAPEPLRIDHYLSTLDEPLQTLRKERRTALKRWLDARNPVVETSVMEDRAEPTPTYLLARGAYDAPRTEAARVARKTPDSLPPMPAMARSDRLGLARWLTEPMHPLTARVAVNRVWQSFFGGGIVSTSEDFGLQGEPPSHPRLLDFLARRFVLDDWNHKNLCRRIVLSATYRQRSTQSAYAQEDPKNRLLWRGPSGRLTGEMLRDSALAAAGIMERQVGGPPVSPYQPKGLWREANTMSPAYRQSVGRSLYRRSLYTVWKRTAPNPNMVILDAAHRESCVSRRRGTNTPLQALVLLNDVQFVEAARCLGERMLVEGGDTHASRIAFGFRLLTGRAPDAFEARTLLELYRAEELRYRDAPDEAKKLATAGEHKPREGLDPVAVAAATVIAQTILNLDATVWKR